MFGTAVEDALSKHGAVVDNVVVGEQHLVGGEVPLAFVILREESSSEWNS